ncbi:MAG TPA: hypothetical protein VNC39_07650 [Acidocella sp.]|jgi:hypothetical protein|uniref:hypothetical protein n=1 Tax=Acidocella sp. TaxID=50710 RepID=UPI002C9B3F0A|nr:hypothetical protein [Acidocella sp.]HVE21833.1 hypothetical protein [Acidocella sp.]
MGQIITAGRLLLARPGLALMAANAPHGGVASGLANLALFGHGQSNAAYANDQDGALLAMAQAIATYLDAAGTPAGVSNSASDVSGAGVYAGVAGYGSFLTYGGDTAAAASAAAYGADGTAMLGMIAALAPAARAATLAGILYWGETDSALTAFSGNGGLGYADKPVYKAALLNDIGQIRAAFGKSAAAMPFGVFGPPYGTPTGAAMVREAWVELAADPANNLVWAVPQTYDSITRGNNWNAATGVETLGLPNPGHRDAADNVAFYRRGALAMARAILASNGLAASLLPAALGAGTGPRIVAATLSGARVVLTIQHDGGTDLLVPAFAPPNGADAPLPAQGVGFSVMDGGSVTAPGTMIRAVACTRLDATHLQLTLASAPTNQASACRLFYPWPDEMWADQPLTEIGRGCAVTDNFGQIAVPADYDLNQLLGAGWRMNMPLGSPVSMTGSGASANARFGIALSPA